ncbi:MAG: hypothetical protein HXS48_24165 [Theionarchaea archaeon]|nr:hypothetical protein [Theionarchaea archaeon]
MEDEDKMEYCTTLDEYLTRITPFGFSGAVLVAKNGNIFLNKGYGMPARKAARLSPVEALRHE